MGTPETERQDSQSGAEDTAAAAATAPASAPAGTPETELVPVGNDVAGGLHPKAPEPSDTPGQALGDSAPSLDSLQGQQCPNCNVGILYVIRYDPKALHEAGQDYSGGMSPPAMPSGFESGGGYEQSCFYCGWRASFPLNPGRFHGRVR